MDLGFGLRLDTLGASIGDLRVTPSIPAGRSPRVVQIEPVAKQVERDDSASWTAYLAYRNAEGIVSERRFTCHAIVGFEGATHVTGYCHERGAPRMLRVDRISELICAETGETFDPLSHFDELRQQGALRCEDKVLTDVARILVFLARCDGTYHPLEQQGLAEQLHRYCIRFNATECMADEAIAASRRLAPDGADMIKAIRAMAKSPGGPRVARFVLDAGAAIIDADGQHAAEEVRWAVEMSNTLKAVCDRRVH